MLKQLLFLCVVVLISRPAFAATIVWEAFGELTSANYRFPFPPPPDFPNQVPPVGTTYSLQLQFDPSASSPTPDAPPGSPCSFTAVTGSFALGGFSYGLSGNAFTSAQLPGANCLTSQPPGAIDFFLAPTTIDTAAPWDLTSGTKYLNLRYFDLVHQDGTFPTFPMFAFPGSLYFENDFFNFGAPFAPHAVVDQAAPVPEPGSMTLLGIGLAYGASRYRRLHRR